MKLGDIFDGKVSYNRPQTTQFIYDDDNDNYMSIIDKRKKTQYDDNIAIDDNDIYHQLLNTNDEIGDDYPDIVFANGLFILGDFKYFTTYEEFNDLEFGHSGLMVGFERKYAKVLQEYEKANRKMCIVEGYYNKNTIAFISDNANKQLGELCDFDIDNDESDIIKSIREQVNYLFRPATLADKEKAAPIILRKLNVQKVYALYVPDNRHMRRLAKLLKKKK